jgi:hypothetical protein
MEFFNFGNSQTFHFFEYVTKSGKVPVDELMAKAQDAIDEKDLDLYDVCECLANEMVNVFADALDDAIDAAGLSCNLEALQCGEWLPSEHGGHIRGEQEEADLFRPILAEALEQINFYAVAVAILLSKGKWNPDNTIPESK